MSVELIGCVVAVLLLIGVIVIIKNKQQKRVKEVQQELEFFKKEREYYNEAMLLLNIKAEIVYANLAAKKLFGLQKDEKSGNATDIIWQCQPAPETTDTHPGVYCLRTSQTDWDESTLWNTYTMLTDLEAVFRSLKSELGLRPVHHQIAKRVSGHLFITVLAYHLVHTIRFRLKQVDIHSSWSSLRAVLSPQSRVTVSMQCKNGNSVHVRKSTRPEPNQQEIYSALGIKSHPGHAVKTTI